MRLQIIISLQAIIMFVCFFYSQTPGTGDDGAPTGSCEAQLSAGYMCIKDTK